MCLELRQRKLHLDYSCDSKCAYIYSYLISHRGHRRECVKSSTGALSLQNPNLLAFCRWNKSFHIYSKKRSSIYCPVNHIPFTAKHFLPTWILVGFYSACKNSTPLICDMVSWHVIEIVRVEQSRIAWSRTGNGTPTTVVIVLFLYTWCHRSE